MRTAIFCALASLITLTAAAQGTRTDPERLLAERFQFTAGEVAQARQGAPVVRVKADGEQLVAGGAIKLPGKKERLAEWLRNIEHFRTAAELGITHVIPSPPSAAAFADVTLDAPDLAELQQCDTGKCGIRVSGAALATLKNGPTQAADTFRQMLLGYVTAYVNGGHAAIAQYDGPQAKRTFADDMLQLIQQSTRVIDLAPDLAGFLGRFPAASLPASDQLFYWSSVPAGSNTIVSLHHLVVYRPGPSEVWIADKNFYATRYIDAGLLTIALFDAPDGSGFYAIAGSRVRASRLGGVGGTVLRRTIQRSASDTVKNYLEWLRDSLK
jgi:hypothetical protein